MTSPASKPGAWTDLDAGPAEGMRTLVIGAGISGISCARVLADAGIPVRVADRGRAIGGRMASRWLPRSSTAGAPGGHVTDIGASYFTVKDPYFATSVQALASAGVVRPWTDSFAVFEGGRITGRRTGPMRYAAPAGLRSVVEALAEGIAVASSTDLTSVHVDGAGLIEVDGQEVDAVALCMPGPQAHRLISGTHPGAEAAREAAMAMTWEPVIAVAAGFAEVCWDPFDGVFVNDDLPITWIADDGARRGNAAPVLVAHVAPSIAATCLDDPERVREPALEAVRRVLSIEARPDWVDVQRWTFARPTGASDDPCYLDRDLGLGLAGDAWAGGPRVEAAWCSGRALGQALAERLDARR